MPTLSQFFQPPLYWQQFEELAVGMLREVYDIPTAQGFGRPGQAQNGVDVYGKSRRFGMIGIQCKRLTDRDEKGNPLPGGAIRRNFLRAAAKESLAFTPKLDLWILATTARRDTAVQGWVNELNDEWEQAKRNCFALVWSWDECISYLNSFPDLQRWYYEDVIKIRGAADLDEMILRTIAMAFDRPAFEVPLHCETSTEFRDALSDTQRAVRTGELLDRQSRNVIRKSVGGWREISDPGHRERIGKISAVLRKLRAELEQGFKNGAIRHINGYLDFTDLHLAHQLELMREECVDRLNLVLRDASIPTI